MPQRQPETDTNEAQQQGSYDCQRQVVFKDFTYVTTLDSQQSNGYTLLKKGSLGQIFIVDNDNASGYQPAITTVGIADKQVKTNCNQTPTGYTYNVSVDMLVRNVRTGQISKGGLLYPKSQSLLNSQILLQAQIQAQQDINAFLHAQQMHDIDVIGCYQHFYAKYKDKWDSSIPVSNINFTVDVTVAED